jgi:hypothetical protein
MADGMDIGQGVARALDDNRVDLNISSGAMDVQKVGGVVQQGAIQPSVQSSVMDVLKHETVLYAGSIAPSTSLGTVIYQTPIDPSQLYSGSNPSRVTWLSKLYKFWTGDLTFRFVFTKTILQQLKLLAVFVPGASASDPAPTPQQAYYYRHKVLMNPANEMEWSLDVPFVSTKPHHVMGEQTGMLYVMLFQPMAVSNNDASSISIDIFVAGPSLRFHEFVLLPALAGLTTISPGNSFILQSFSGSAANPGNTGTKTFLSDNDTTLATALGNDASLALFTFTNGQCIAAGPLIAAEIPYNASTMRTISGSPQGNTISTRQAIFIQQNRAAGVAIGGIAYLTIYIWNDFSFAIAPSSASTICDYQTNVAATGYNNTFPSTFTAFGDSAAMNARIMELEEAIRMLLERV